eukprot:TRINITY_DN28039_c0_g1_i1.p1 TRINITY_DN28039_c0_g1~~TRINITY_DN28039_c0_g1_i1.p1  ORF type:complete len:136 (-),score=19.34 TRINITY_DN28039_c0_g1_i1:137-544(-)
MGWVFKMAMVLLAVAAQYLCTYRWPPTSSTSSTPRSMRDVDHPVQPDQVRLGASTPDMKCGKPIVSRSNTETDRVEIFVQSSFRGQTEGPEFSWKYEVEIRNRGDAPVQMLTRHWVFVDATGRVEEVKGLSLIHI